MSRFEVELEITGFKLRIKGNRDDVPAATQAVGQQIAGMLAPAAQIVEGEAIDVPSRSITPPAPVQEQKNGKKRPARSRAAPNFYRRATAKLYYCQVDVIDLQTSDRNV